MTKFEDTLPIMYLSLKGYKSINNIEITYYTLKELEETIIDCIRTTLVDRSTQGIIEYLNYVIISITKFENATNSDDFIFRKYISFLNWLKEQISYLEQGGAIDYSVILSKDQNNTKYSSFIEILIEIEATLYLEENCLLPLIRLLKDEMIKLNHTLTLWKLFVIIDLACSRGYFLNNGYLACSDRKSKDKFVRDFLCKKVTNKNGQKIIGKEISDSIRQSMTIKMNCNKESPNYKEDTSNFNEFSIKMGAIFDKWTFR